MNLPRTMLEALDILVRESLSGISSRWSLRSRTQLCSIVAEGIDRRWRPMPCNRWDTGMSSRWMEGFARGGRLGTRWNNADPSSTLLVGLIELLDHLLGEINRILVVDHDLDGLFAPFVDDD